MAEPELGICPHFYDYYQVKVVLALIQDSIVCGFYIRRLETYHQQPQTL
jgi:hypothetical protein